ncbi:MAG: alcohol dehydrogenase catalytic domain-containing protein [Nitriliruptoraceae bacterium]|nr:alcohol dehydrogenase catalytic domain-containing protein [Nitriliruptoraceae bacterium]
MSAVDGTATMAAARWFARDEVRVVEVDVPRAGAAQVLVRVEAVGICGTDLEEYREGPISVVLPREGDAGSTAGGRTLGHEVVGTVIDSPGDPTLVGQRVIPDVVVGCGDCWWCRRHEEGLCPDLQVRGMHLDGGLATFMLADVATCVPVPDHVGPDVAVFAEPLAVAVRALAKAGPLHGATVAVTGLGTIGLLVGQLALRQGAAHVVASDPSERKRSLAAGWGMAATHPEGLETLLRARSGGRGAAGRGEGSGAPAVAAQALARGRSGGAVVIVGFKPVGSEVALLDLVLGEKRILGSAAHLWDSDVAAAVGLLASGSIETTPLVSDVIGLHDIVTAGFERLADDPDVLKVVVRPDGDVGGHGP